MINIKDVERNPLLISPTKPEYQWVFILYKYFLGCNLQKLANKLEWKRGIYYRKLLEKIQVSKHLFRTQKVHHLVMSTLHDIILLTSPLSGHIPIKTSKKTFSTLVRNSVDKVLIVSPCTKGLLKCNSMKYSMGRKLLTWRWPNNSSKISLVWVDMLNTAFLKLVSFVA